MSTIIVKQEKSIIGQSKNHVLVIRSLGLGRIGLTKTHKDNNCIRGMLNKVRHLVSFQIKN